MSNLRTYACLVCAVAISVASEGLGAITTYTGALSGPNENPQVPSAGTGTALVTYDSTLKTLRVQVTFSGLTGTTTAAHIHCCVAPPGIVGVATQTPTFVLFPLGVTSGSFDNTLDLTLASSYNAPFVTANGGTAAGAEAALVAGLDAGMAYLNVHSTFAPGGEIRSFLEQQREAVPSTSAAGGAALALLLAAAGAALLLRRH
jgi:hypothetical protein